MNVMKLLDWFITFFGDLVVFLQFIPYKDPIFKFRDPFDVEIKLFMSDFVSMREND